MIKRCTYQQYLGIKDINACIDAIKTKIKYKIDEKRYIYHNSYDRQKSIGGSSSNEFHSLFASPYNFSKKGIIIKHRSTKQRKEKTKP